MSDKERKSPCSVFNDQTYFGCASARYMVKIKEDTYLMPLWKRIDSHTRRRKYNNMKTTKRTNCFNTKAKQHEKSIIFFFLSVLKSTNTSPKDQRDDKNYCSIDEMQWLGTNKTVLKTKSGPVIPFILESAFFKHDFSIHRFTIAHKVQKAERRQFIGFSWEYCYVFFSFILAAESVVLART